MAIFDELAIGQEFGGEPGLTLTPGLAAAHQAITGDRLALVLDHELCHQVTGGGPLASPSLVWDVAIGLDQAEVAGDVPGRPGRLPGYRRGRADDQGSRIRRFTRRRRRHLTQVAGLALRFGQRG